MLNVNGGSSSIVKRTAKFSEFKQRTGRGGEESSCSNVAWISVLLVSEIIWNMLLILVMFVVLLYSDKYNNTDVGDWHFAHFEAA